MVGKRAKAYKSRGVVEAADAARGEAAAANVASTIRTDAVTSGIVHGGDRFRGTVRSSTRPKSGNANRLRGKVEGLRSEGAAPSSDVGTKKAKGASAQLAESSDGAEAGTATPPAEGHAGIFQRRLHLKAAVADWATSELDDSDELEGIDEVQRDGRSLARVVGSARQRSTIKSADAQGSAVEQGKRGTSLRTKPRTSVQTSAGNASFSANAGTGQTSAPRKAPAGRTSKERRQAAQATKRMQQRRGWLAARAAHEGTAPAAPAGSMQTAKAAGTARRAAGAKTLAAAATSAAAPLAGVFAGVLCFVLCALLAGQLVSSLFGFWDNEAKQVSLEGLPPYITAEMVEAAIECQEKYGHPAGCTIAQIICESGMGDHLSGLATQDRNLFGIKWAASFLGCPEVSGKSAWSTQEEYGGALVTIMDDFTSFKSYADCVRFRSRVLLANSRYADNPLIRQAIAAKDSDKMAEGLKDAGYATSSSYVETLKSILDTYSLRRFDGLSLKDYKSGVANGSKVLEAAMSQLGVPYVWGGTTPGAGLDCSGLTQWCYAQAGISIPRNSEDQAAAGRKVPLSEAKPGDILWRPGHVALYVGGDEYIHEPQSGDVCRKAYGIAYFDCAVRF